MSYRVLGDTKTGRRAKKESEADDQLMDTRAFS